MSFNYEENRENIRFENLQKLKNKYENYDNDYFYNYHDKNYFKVTKRRYRTIWTEYGLLTYLRRIYKYKSNGDIFIPTDKYIGIEPYNRIINEIRFSYINELDSGKRNRDIKDKWPNIKISSQTITNILNKSKVNKINQKKIKVEDNKKLYLNMDDCFEWLINDDKVLEKYCIRIFSFNTGKQFISKNRNKLLNKRIAFMIFKPSDNITQDKVYYFITDTINNNYDIKLNILGKDWDYHNYNLVVAGDGALWIRAMANWLGCNYILDKYHAFSYLWKSFVSVKGKKKESTDWTKYIDTSLFFADGNYNQLLNILKK